MSKEKGVELAQAVDVSREIMDKLRGFCFRIEVAGSVRRQKERVSDIEILFVPRKIEVPDGLFDKKLVSLADECLDELLAECFLGERPNKLGSVVWGEKNKLAVHVASGIPVDLFATTPECWWNYLVCRTGGKLNNIRIAAQAKRRGLKWHPYSSGFETREGKILHMKSEREVFATVGLSYLAPQHRT